MPCFASLSLPLVIYSYVIQLGKIQVDSQFWSHHHVRIIFLEGLSWIFCVIVLQAIAHKLSLICFCGLKPVWFFVFPQLFLCWRLKAFLSSCSETSMLFKHAYSDSKVSPKKALNPLSCSLELVWKLYLKLNIGPILCGN